MMQLSLSDPSTAFDTQLSTHMPNITTNSTSLTSPAEEIVPRKPSFMDHATATDHVSAFCRSVLSNLLPDEFWGDGETQSHNKLQLMKAVDQFIGLRRFESLSLHDVVQGMRVCSSFGDSRALLTALLRKRN